MYVVVEDFRGGLDRRRSVIAGQPGTAWVLENAHLTRGGEIERAKAFVSTYALPAGETFGLHGMNGALYTFGSNAAPAVPVGVTYQRLQHPDGLSMTAVLASEIFAGKLYVVAKYSNDEVLHFYDGELIEQLIDGRVRASMTNNDGIAAHLAALIDADPDFTGSSVGNIVTVVGPEGEAFTIDAITEDGGGTDDQTAVVATPTIAVPGTSEVLATCSFRVLGGSVSAGTNKITSVKVNNVELLGAAVDFTTSNGVTAAEIAKKINQDETTPNYTAAANGDTVTISAVEGSGSNPNGYVLDVTVAGNVIIAFGSFRITGGTASAGVNKVSAIKVNGIDILGAAVDWTTDYSTTAAAVATQVRSNSGTSGYTSYSSGQKVFIAPLQATSNIPQNLSVEVTVGGNVTVGDVENVTTSCSDMDGGVTSVAGQAQVSTITIGGTFQAGDLFTIYLNNKSFGYAGKPTLRGLTAKTFKGKLYTTVSSYLFFSALDDPTIWDADDNDIPGAGFINLNNNASGSENLVGCTPYQGQLSVFAENAIQIWAMDADDTNNRLSQSLENTGTRAGKSILSYGNNDVFYLSETGVRSLRSRDASNAAFVNDVGTAIDDLVQETMAALTDTQIRAAASVMEPLSGRYMLALGDTIFVFSYFPGSKVSAWSTYKPGFTVNEWATVGTRLYCRSGDAVYLYGGANNDTYPAQDETPVTVILPFLTAGKPGHMKGLRGLDVALEGEWVASVLTDPRDLDIATKTITIAETTFKSGTVPLAGRGTHFGLKFTCSAADYAKLTSLLVHFSLDEDG